MCKVSFLIPTYRDFSQYVDVTVRSVEESGLDFDYEIIVCSKSPYTHHVYIQEPDDNNGSVLPINLAYRAAKGEYIALLNDDFSIDSSFHNIIAMLDKAERPISGLYPNMWKAQNDHKFIPTHGWQFTRSAVQNILPQQMLCFPVGNKTYLQSVLESENLLSSRFKHHWSDVWLSFFLYNRIGRIDLCVDAEIYMEKPSSSAFNDSADENTYFSLIAQYGETSAYE